jgi:hypothetical protein
LEELPDHVASELCRPKRLACNRQCALDQHGASYGTQVKLISLPHVRNLQCFSNRIAMLSARVLQKTLRKMPRNKTVTIRVALLEGQPQSVEILVL